MIRLISSASLAVALIALHSANADPGANVAKPDSEVAPSADPVVARGKGFEIRRRQVDQVLATAIAKNPQEKLPPDADIHVLNQLIEIQLVLQKATDTEKAAGKENAGQRVAAILKAEGPAEFARRLETTHMTEDDLRLMLAQEATAQLSLARQLSVNVTVADAKKYFDSHPGAFDQPEKARVRELLLSRTAGFSGHSLPAATLQAKKQQIDALFKRIQAGEDFAALASQYNEDPISMATGGEFTFQRTQMEFGDLAFSMKPNQISNVLDNSDGYRIFQLLEIIPAKKVAFADVSGKLENGLAGAAKRMRGPVYINALRKEANVEILDPALEAKIAANEAANPPQKAPLQPR